MATHGSAALESHAAPQGFIRKWIFSLDHKVIGLPHDRLRETLKKYNRLAP